MDAYSKNRNQWHPTFSKPTANRQALIDADHFSHIISRERKRAERSGQYLLLFIMDITGLTPDMRSQLVYALTILNSDCIREIDACGWLADNKQAGIIFTEISGESLLSVKSALEKKIINHLMKELPAVICNKIKTDLIVYPVKPEFTDNGHEFNPVFFPELFHRDPETLMAEGAKRVLDIVGSVVAILLFSPFFIVIPLLIKLTSPGPVFFRQERLGKFGTTFKILKFRSMSTNNDDSIHRKYVGDLIANKIKAEADDGNGGIVFKLQNDPRVTPLGQFLRKSSLDEIPQFFNVLRGEMSLVGPRPPIPYEVNAYYLWHCYRSFAVKPGITGLWQVSGRSQTTFDDMVRLDIQYIRNWSLWLDIKLLLATPRAVLKGAGAC